MTVVKGKGGFSDGGEGEECHVEQWRSEFGNIVDGEG